MQASIMQILRWSSGAITLPCCGTRFCTPLKTTVPGGKPDEQHPHVQVLRLEIMKVLELWYAAEFADINGFCRKSNDDLHTPQD
jgi:hypothetical protein